MTSGNRLDPEMLIDGRPAEQLPADDRGLLYGDGLFETVAFHSGHAALWDLHMARLARGCRVLDMPEPDAKVLREEAGRLAGDSGAAVIRITWTRGSGGRAYMPPERPQPRRILMRRSWPENMARQRTDGITMITAGLRLAGAPALSGLKHLNRLEQVLIGAECRRHGVDEALVLDRDGHLAEALTGNLVLVRDSRLLTPEQVPGAVEGVGLQWLMRTAGAEITRCRLGPEAAGEECGIWVINSVAGFRPVARLDGQSRPITALCREWQRRWLEFTGETI